MIITVKNLQQQTFTIDFDPEKTVLELKKQIFEERGAEYFVEKQKLIYAGVILTDERTISSYKVDEKKFIVVMLSRDVIITSSSTNADAQRKHNELTESSITEAEKKPVIHNTNVSSNQKEIKTKTTSEILGVEVESTGAGSSATTQTSTAAPVPLDTGSTAAITDYSSIDLVGELANASIQTRAESNLLMGEEFNRTVASMVEMGYPREQVERAMAASFNNPERAVEYLINGIPQDENLFNPGDEEEPNRAERNRRQGGENDLLTESAADPFEFLRSQPQFLQMRSLIYQNPHLLHAVLQQIGQTNPALLQLISENQDAFLNMLNQPLDDETGDNAQRVGRTLSSTSGRTESSTTANFIAEVNADGQRSAPSSDDQSIAIATESDDSVAAGRNIQTENLATIRLTPHDQDAIERLKALGFPEALVLQAYFACEKDEELAANFLLSSSFDD